MWCPVSADPDAGDGWCLPVKLSKEKLFKFIDVGASATLLYIGNRSEFCLVEFVCRVDAHMNDGSVQEKDDGKLEAASGCLLCLTPSFF
jgi:hypothetical protein